MGCGLPAALVRTKKKQQPTGSCLKAELFKTAQGRSPDPITSSWSNSIISLVVQL